MSCTRTAVKRTRGIWRPESEAVIDAFLAMKREETTHAHVASNDDDRLIATCTACGYLGYCEEMPIKRRNRQRVFVCEECRGSEQSQAGTRKPVQKARAA